MVEMEFRKDGGFDIVRVLCHGICIHQEMCNEDATSCFTLNYHQGMSSKSACRSGDIVQDHLEGFLKRLLFHSGQVFLLDADHSRNRNNTPTHEKVVVTLSEAGIGECFEGFLQNVSLQERK
jgi:hypothetical protein